MRSSPDYRKVRLHQHKLIISITLLMWSINLGTWLLVSGLRNQEFSLPLWLLANSFLIPLIWLLAKSMNRFPVLIVLICGPFIALISSLVDFQIFSYLYVGTFPWNVADFDLPKFLLDVYLYSLFYFAWYLAYTAIHNYYRFLRQSVAAIEAESQADAAQLAMLRYQINPHFLFNTLNSISALVLSESNEKAEKMISGLSRFLRYSLDNSPNKLVSLAQEVEMIREYLTVEKIRFEDRLEFEFAVNDEASRCLVPSFILQPAVENAIKHAVAPSKQIIHLKIYGFQDKKKLVFGISDSGPGLNLSQSNFGIGLSNMKHRLAVLYKGEANVEIRNNMDGGAVVEFKLPIRTSEKTFKVSQES